MRRALFFYGLLFCCFSSSASTGYFSDPALNDDLLIFTSEGDLWVKQLDAPNASRLTSSVGIEQQATISKNGKYVGFIANYEGSQEVYVMPLSGGKATRLTFENSNILLHGFVDNNTLLYSTDTHIGPTRSWLLKTVSIDTKQTHEIPLIDAVEGNVDIKGEYLYFTQFGLQLTGDNAHYYKGGAQGEIWRYQLGKSEEAQILTKPINASTTSPMPYQGKVYFVSNQNGINNLWVMNANGENPLQLTHYEDYPVRNPSLNKGKIVFQHGADINLYDIQRKTEKTLQINVRSDYPQHRTHFITKPLDYLESAYFSEENNKVAITARGRIIVTSNDGSRITEIATPPNSRSHYAVLSHDGKWVYAINDASGEMEIWQYAANGSAQQSQLTSENKISRWRMVQSPDGKWLAHDDFNGDLWLLNLSTLENKKVLSGQSEILPYNDIVWSPDSKLLAITTLRNGNSRGRIALVDIDSGRSQLLTSNKYSSYSPAFSPDGNWLYFLSERAFEASLKSPWGDRNMGTQFYRRTQIFAYALNADTSFPWTWPNELDEKAEQITSQRKNENDGEEENGTESPEQSIEWDDLTSRLWQVPVAAGNYFKLNVTSNALLVLDRNGGAPSLKNIDMSPNPQIKNVVDNVADYQVGNNGDNMFVRLKNQNKMVIVPTGTFPQITESHEVNTKDWSMAVTPKQEWSQIFNDAWRMHRDYFFDKEMRHKDWPAIREKYLPLLSRVSHRAELNDLLGQMNGELNILHSQVRGGDIPKDKTLPTPATLGAKLTQQKNGVFISHIYKSDNEVPASAPPLNKPGVNAQNGDRISHINGKKVNTLQDVNNALLNQANHQVVLTLQRDGKSHNTVVYPQKSQEEQYLRYQDWVTSNREKVSNADDNIGYLHLRSMTGNDIADFAREFYAAIDKNGLIIDVRRNKGGNIDSWIIEKLLRKVWMFWDIDNQSPLTNMQQTFRGHLVVLADQLTYSDGETFVAGIKALDLAPIIGKQTAGAGVWLRDRNVLSDKGIARVAEMPVFSTDGRWLIEGRGVSPTIEVTNLPHATFMGSDAQLDAALAYLSKMNKQAPVMPLIPSPYPPSNESGQDIHP